MAVLSKPQQDFIQEMIANEIRVYFTQARFPNLPPSKVPTTGAFGGVANHIPAFDGSGGMVDTAVKLSTTGGESIFEVDGNNAVFQSKLAAGEYFLFRMGVAFTPGDVLDKATGGDIGNANVTVDILSLFRCDQTTAAQTLTLPAPTDTTACRIVTVINIGSTSFTMLGKTVDVGAGLIAQWSGSAWALLGA